MITWFHNYFFEKWVTKRGNNETYLGNSLIINKNKNSNFQNLINKIKCRIMPWQLPLLSKTGRSTLIKKVASSIPVYNMSVFKLPYEISEMIDELFRNFFLGEKMEKKEVA